MWKHFGLRPQADRKGYNRGDWRERPKGEILEETPQGPSEIYLLFRKQISLRRYSLSASRLDSPGLLFAAGRAAGEGTQAL